MHKAASTYVGSILKEIFARQGYRTEDIAAEAFEAGVNEVDYIRHNIGAACSGSPLFWPLSSRECPADRRSDLAPTHSTHTRPQRLRCLSYSLAFSHVEPGRAQY
jgi:hypothetical protein